MYHWKFIPKIMRKTEWAPMGFRFRLKNCLRFLLCVSLQGKPSPRFSSPLGGHRLCQGMDAQCPFLKIDFLIFQTLGGCIKDVIRKIISSSPRHFLMTPALIHPCRHRVSAFSLMRNSKKEAQCKPTWEKAPHDSTAHECASGGDGSCHVSHRPREGYHSCVHTFS